MQIIDAGGLKIARIEFTDGHIGRGDPPNVYIILSRPITIIDTGIKSEANEMMFNRSLKELGLKVSDISNVILTHWHWDHSGLASSIVAQSGAQTIAHVYELPRLMGGYGDLCVLSENTKAFYRSHGLSADLSETLVALAYSYGLPSLELKHMKAVSDGEEIIGDDYRLKILHTPGHTPGSICVYEENTGILFGSDTLYGRLFPHPVAEIYLSKGGLIYSSLGFYPASLEKLGLMNFSQCLPGHGSPFSPVKDVIDAVSRFIERRLSRLMRLLESADRPRSAKDILEILFPNIGDFEIYPAVAEVILLLEVAEKRDLICRTAHDDGISRFVIIR